MSHRDFYKQYIKLQFQAEKQSDSTRSLIFLLKIFISFFKKHPFPIDKYQCDVYNSIDDSQCEALIMEREECTKILKALADDTRMQIFEILRGGTLCGCKILEQLNITQPTLSHHMKELCDCGLVKAEKDWKWTYYTLACCKLNEMLDFLGDTKCRTGRTNEDTCKKNTCD